MCTCTCNCTYMYCRFQALPLFVCMYMYMCHVHFSLFVSFTEETDDEEDDYEEEEPGFKALVGRHDKREYRPFFLICFVGVPVSIQYCVRIMAHTMYNVQCNHPVCVCVCVLTLDLRDYQIFLSRQAFDGQNH